MIQSAPSWMGGVWVGQPGLFDTGRAVRGAMGGQIVDAQLPGLLDNANTLFSRRIARYRDF